jgi:hypothetical protein
MSEFVITKLEPTKLEVKHKRVLPEKSVNKTGYRVFTVNELISVLSSIVEEDKELGEAKITIPSYVNSYDGVSLVDTVSVISTNLNTEDTDRFNEDGFYSKEKGSVLTVKLNRFYQSYESAC